VRPRFLPSDTPPRRFAKSGAWLAILFEIAFIVTSAQLFGLGHAVANAIGWLFESN
jgi:hypothetical protein